MSNAQSGMRFDAGIQYCGTKCLNRFIYRKYWVTTILIFCSMVVTYISVLVSGGLLVSSFVSVLVKYCVLVIILVTILILVMLCFLDITTIHL